MREIEICDVTLKELDSLKKLPHTFRQRIEIAKLLDRLGLSVIRHRRCKARQPSDQVHSILPEKQYPRSAGGTYGGKRRNNLCCHEGGKASKASGRCRSFTCKDGICIPSEAAKDA